MPTKTILAVMLLLLTAPTGADTGVFHLKTDPLAGTWRSKKGSCYVTYWDDTPYLIRSTDGKAWTLNRENPDDPAFNLSGMDDSATGVTIRMHGEDAWRVEPDGSVIGAATRVPYPAEDFVAKNGEAAELHGTILWPVGSEPKAMVLYLNGEGPNPRTNLLPTALGLLESNYGAVIFDQRHAGESTGVANDGTYYERSRRAANDATVVSKMVTKDPRFRKLPVGVVGWSQGGWIGAIVTRQNPDLDFYVNVAGSATPGWQQWRHAMASLLIRKNIGQPDLNRAQAYFDAFFGVMLGEIPWETYTAARTAARKEAWWSVMKRRYVAEWESEDEAREFGLREIAHTPAEDFRAVTVPTLGVFFEFDGSTPPDSPGIFAAALAESESSSFTVIQLPGLQHGSWVVEGYADSAARFATRSQEVNDTIADWLERTRRSMK